MTALEPPAEHNEQELPPADDATVLDQVQTENGEAVPPGNSGATGAGRGLSSAAIAGISIVVALIMIVLVVGAVAYHRRRDNATLKSEASRRASVSFDDVTTSIATACDVEPLPLHKREASELSNSTVIDATAPDFEEGDFTLSTDGWSVRLKSVRRQNPAFIGPPDSARDVVGEIDDVVDSTM
jgi:hypothetical protein